MQAAAEAGDTFAEATADAAFHGGSSTSPATPTLAGVATLEPFSPDLHHHRLSRRRPAAHRRRARAGPRRPSPADPDRGRSRCINKHFEMPAAGLAATGPDPSHRTPRPPWPARGRVRPPCTAAPAGQPDRLTCDHAGAKDTMNDTLHCPEGVLAGAARLRVDVFAGGPREHVLDDLTFSTTGWRTSASRRRSRSRPGLRLEPGRRQGRGLRRPPVVTFTGDGGRPIQKVVVAVLRCAWEDVGLHPSHSAAVNYRARRSCSGRRVQPRQVHGPDRGRHPGRPSRSRPRPR